MPENAVLNESMDEIEFGFVKREATPQALMTLSIQLQLAGLSLSNTISVLEWFGVDRGKSTVHNWVHKAELQPEDGRSPDHVPVDETVIRLDDEQYWLYAAVDLDANELLLEAPTNQNERAAHAFFAELREQHDVDDVPRNRRFLVCGRDAVRLVNAVFLVDGATPLKDACTRHGLDSRYERHGNPNSVERIFRGVTPRTTAFSNCFSHASAETADEWLKSYAFAWNQLI